MRLMAGKYGNTMSRSAFAYSYVIIQGDLFKAPPKAPPGKKSKYYYELLSLFAVVQPLIKILKQPWSQLIPKGGRFRLLCEAVNSGDEPLQYQWYFSGMPIAGATESVLIR